MATVTITNLTTSDVWLADIYATVPASGSIDITRNPTDLDKMAALKAAILAGTLSTSIALSAADVAAGFMTPPQSVEVADLSPVAATDVASPFLLLRKAVTAGVGATADDVTIYAVNTLPFKCRIVDVWATISAAGAGSSSATVRTAAAGAGTAIATVATDATGQARGTLESNATAAITPGGTVGLFLRRTDNTAAGEVFMLVRRES